MLTRRILLGALALASAPLVRAFAAVPPPKAAVLTAAQQAEVGQIETYLNAIRTLSSSFEQVSGEGNVASGKLYLSRPGRMRFEYDPPVPILLVADGLDIHYYDRELQQLSDMRIESTPAAFLLRDRIALSGSVTLTRYDHLPGAIRLTFVETSEPDQGSVTLTLTEHPLELRQWTVVDPQQKRITITLTDPHYGVSLDPRLFQWTDPRPTQTGH
ncbi:MAG TPA: outer membrane lipoprotein carrier protein LolA [Stellaceae bacterium]|nr:outer membrane lipoprotein carrier protein LolA [Stellaceae bacterium]